MTTKILIVVAVVIAAFLVIVAFQPAAYRVERSLPIAASPAQLFPQLNDLRQVHAWSPWVQLDPAGKYTFEGPPEGPGAVALWAGNSQVGEGRQTITESRPGELVRTKLEFKKPFESTCTADFTLQPQGPQTVVTWSMWGENNFMAKAFCLFISQDKMIGEQFEKGLATLKARVEGAAK